MKETALSQRSVVGLILCGTLLFGAGTLLYPLDSPDNSTFMVIAREMLRGSAPYVDVWDIKGPGIFFAFALVRLLFGASSLALRVFELLWQAGTALLLAGIAERVYRARAAGLIAAVSYLLVYFSQNPLNFGQADGWITLPLALAFYFALRAMDSDRFYCWLLAGAGVGMAVLFKLPFGLVGVFLLAVAFLKSREPAVLLRRAAALAVGFGVPVLACAAYLYAKGALGEYFAAQVISAPQYVLILRAAVRPAAAARTAMVPTRLLLYMLLLFGLGSVVRAVLRRERVLPGAWLVFAWLVLCVLVLVLHGGFFIYHYLPLFAPAAVLASAPVWAVLTGIRQGRTLPRVLLLVVIVGSLVVPVEKFRQHYSFAWRSLHGSLPPDPWANLGVYLRAHTAPEDRIYVWGIAVRIYLEADRRPAARFLLPTYVALPLAGVDQRQQFMADFLAHKPKYFVLVKAREQQVPLGMKTSLETYYSHFDALRKTIEAEFEIVEQTERYTLFRRKDGAGSP